MMNEVEELRKLALEENKILKGLSEKMENFEKRLDALEVKLEKVRQAVDLTISALEKISGHE